MTALFTYRPIGDLLERWQWTTDLITAEDGTEARRAVRDIPVQSWEWDIEITDRAYHALIRGQHTAEFYVPAWQEGEVLSAGLAAESTQVDVDTDVGDWRSKLVLWSSPTNCEVVTIDSVGAGTVYFLTPCTNTYPAGSVVAPLRTARLSNVVSLSTSQRFIRADLTWTVTDSTVFSGYDWTMQFDSLDVVTDKNILEGDFTERSLESSLRTFDYALGDIGYDAAHESDVWSMPSLRFVADSPAEIWKWKTWLHKIQGRYGSFWVPSWQADLTLYSGFLADDTWLSFDNVGYSTLLDGMLSNKALFFQQIPLSSSLLRTVVDSGEIDADEEWLQVNAALGFAGSTNAFPFISWLYRCRLNTDQVELVYSPGSKMAVSLPIRELLGS